ncbi:TadE/TadG family type IV pilus assembly protein [Sinorhizobium sp. GL28]|uniref:TadE/TadG family type IV pilus assembly protein n=1 Tax=Sinorhizobium sp. GL28 TaxID=1358418 RepID=UPI00071CA663|nr:TadE/TadG family type IV pilus assembly protein [Sinorhizobium sp. GL28]KSV94048.1 hypothetical protein N184_18905 [Sinorhizobium sp. GL28]
MMALRHLIRHRLCLGFWWREEGAVLAEALVVVPFVTLFAAGILEFGNIFWERMQIDAGLRDAGRYWSRCRQSATYTSYCTEEIARQIAFYGSPIPPAGTPLRVPGWGPGTAALTISPISTDGTITVATSHLYQTSPLFGWLGIDAITINSSHEERYIGW